MILFIVFGLLSVFVVPAQYARSQMNISRDARASKRESLRAVEIEETSVEVQHAEFSLPKRSTLSATPLSGNHKVGAGKEYTTLANAVAAVKSNGVSGPVRLLLTDATYTESAILLTGVAGSGGANTITFQPDTGNSSCVVGLNVNNTENGCFVIKQMNAVIINGNTADGITQQALTIRYDESQSVPTNQYAGAIRIISSSNVTIKNCKVLARFNTAQTVGYDAISSLGDAVGGICRDNRIENCVITSGRYGINQQGVSASNPDKKWTINQNKIGGAFATLAFLSPSGDIRDSLTSGGIISAHTDSSEFTANEIDGIRMPQSIIYTSDIRTYGLQATTATHCAMGGNRINDIAWDRIDGPLGTGGSGSGIRIFGNLSYANPGLNIVYNNSVSQINSRRDFTLDGWPCGSTVTVLGMVAFQDRGIKIYHNSIWLSQSTNNCGRNICLSLAGAAAPPFLEADIQDNIFVNTSSNGGSVEALYLGNGCGSIATEDHDVFYVPTGEIVRGVFALDQYNAGCGFGAQSVTGDPQFVSSSDLHLKTNVPSAANGVGVTLSGQTFDRDGIAWDAVHPDAGCYESTSQLFLKDVQPTRCSVGYLFGNPEGYPDSVKIFGKNNGNASETFDVNVQIKDSSNAVLYNSTVSITVSPFSFFNRTFSTTWTSPVTGSLTSYTTVIQTLLSGDDVPSNDVLTGAAASFPVVSALPYSTSFETVGERDGWLGTGDWEEGTPQKFGGANTGSQAWATRLADRYHDGINSFLFSPYFDLSGQTFLRLGFWQSLRTEPSWDGGVFQYTTDRGSTWHVLGELNDTLGTNWYNTDVYANAAGSSSCLAATAAPDGSVFPVGPKWTSNGDCQGGDYSTGPFGYYHAQRSVPELDGKPLVQFRYWTFQDAATNDSGWVFDDFSISATPTGSISGTKFRDANQSGTFDPGEAGVANWPVLLAGDTTRHSLSFDGVDDYVGIPHSSKISFSPTSPMTIEAWVYRQGNGSMHIASKKAGCGPPSGDLTTNYQLLISTTEIQFQTDNSIARASSVPPLNTWTHVAGTFDGSTLRLYVNGTLVGSSAGTLGSPNTGELKIGAGGICGAFWNGKIDEVRVWNIARSGKQIQDAMNYLLTGSEPGLVGYWRFDEGAGGFAEDATDNRNTGKLVNGTSWVLDGPHSGVAMVLTDQNGLYGFPNLLAATYTVSELQRLGWSQTMPGGAGTYTVNLGTNQTIVGKDFGNYHFAASVSGVKFEDVNRNGSREPEERGLSDWKIRLAGDTNLVGIQFDGVDDYVSIPDAASLDIPSSGPLTVEAWVYRTGSGGIAHILGKRDPACAGINYQLAYDGGGIVFGTNNSNVHSGTYPPLGSWMHIAGTFDGSTYKLYTDGELAGTAFGTLGVPNSSNLLIGASSSCSFLWQGIIDEVRIWNVVRTQAEIQASMKHRLSGSESGLVGYWRFNEGTGLSTMDATANGNTGTLTNGPQWVASSALVIDSTLTDQDGVYSFDNLSSGLYAVSEANQNRWVQTTPSGLGKYLVDLAVGEDRSGIDFGNFRLHSICGKKYNDLNGNGIQDPGEPELPDWRISIVGPQTKTVTTDLNGFYCFDTLDYGTYTVSEEIPQGWEQTAPPPPGIYTLTIGRLPGQSDSFDGGIDFGNHVVPRVKFSVKVDDGTTNRTITCGVRIGAAYGIWGVDPNATSADSAEGERELPPVGGGVVDARFADPRGGLLFGNGSWTDVRNFASDAQVDSFKVNVIPGSAGYPIAVSWSSSLLQSSYDGSVLVYYGVGNVIDMKSVNGFSIPSSAVPYFIIVASRPHLPYIYPRGWSMISLRVLPPSDQKSILFPTASSTAFYYAPGTGYVPTETMVPGIGYWLRFPDAVQSLVFSGTPRTSETIDITSDWNLIGTVSYPVPVSSIQTIPDDIRSGNFFGFKTAYVIADTLEPGKAYWVKATQAGQMTLNSSPPSSEWENGNVQTSDQLEKKFGTLSFVDANGCSQVLYFTVANIPAHELQRYDMPPLPPEGLFDVRFGSNRLLESFSPQTRTSVPITISSAQYPLILCWNRKSQDSQFSLLVDSRRIPLDQAGSAALAQAPSHIGLERTGHSETPKHFSLEQCYPNPFNPSTTIAYTLPVDAKVSLQIIDVLGRVVTQLVDEVQVAGYRYVIWNSEGMPTGVYYYELEASSTTNPLQQFHEVRKMLLIK